MNTFKLPQKMMTILVGFIGIGVLSMAVSFLLDVQRGWAGLLAFAWYLTIMGLAGGFWSATQYVTQAKWSVVVRRIPENTVHVLLVAFALLAVVATLGIGNLYEWSHADIVAHDVILQKKAGYLNTPFFWVRIVIYFAAWYGIGMYLLKLSKSQDESKDPHVSHQLLKSGIVYLTIFAFTFTFAVTDFLMSLEPHWFTALYPMYNFAGMATTGISTMIILILLIKKYGGLKAIGPDHMHDMGKYLFAFNTFWAYTVFAMSMLTWFANLPEETYFYEKRFTGDWAYFTSFLWFGHFLVPFFYLISRDTKRSEAHLMNAAWITAFMGFVDVIWMVYGAFIDNTANVAHAETAAHAEQAAHAAPHAGHFIHGFPFGFIEIGLFLGAIGVFGFIVLRAFEKGNQVPEGDPGLQESLDFHQPL